MLFFLISKINQNILLNIYFHFNVNQDLINQWPLIKDRQLLLKNMKIIKDNIQGYSKKVFF
jgi:hypothetical protein